MPNTKQRNVLSFLLCNSVFGVLLTLSRPHGNGAAQHCREVEQGNMDVLIFEGPPENC